MLAARVANRSAKPNGHRFVQTSQLLNFFKSVPVKHLPGIASSSDCHAFPFLYCLPLHEAIFLGQLHLTTPHTVFRCYYLNGKLLRSKKVQCNSPSRCGVQTAVPVVRNGNWGLWAAAGSVNGNTQVKIWSQDRRHTLSSCKRSGRQKLAVQQSEEIGFCWSQLWH